MRDGDASEWRVEAIGTSVSQRDGPSNDLNIPNPERKSLEVRAQHN
jgi:hypothetical protein